LGFSLFDDLLLLAEGLLLLDLALSFGVVLLDLVLDVLEPKGGLLLLTIQKQNFAQVYSH
jgi:hypothetical protein